MTSAVMASCDQDNRGTASDMWCQPQVFYLLRLVLASCTLHHWGACLRSPPSTNSSESLASLCAASADGSLTPFGWKPERTRAMCSSGRAGEWCRMLILFLQTVPSVFIVPIVQRMITCQRKIFTSCAFHILLLKCSTERILQNRVYLRACYLRAAFQLFK